MARIVKTPSREKYDFLIVGAGITGAVFAEQARTMYSNPDGTLVTCLVIDKREHIAGNAFTQRKKGIDIHEYGAHIFHTSDESVWEYVNQFADFISFVNSPIARYGDEMYNLPFNMNTFVRMWPNKTIITPDDAIAAIEQEKDEYLSQFGDESPENLEQQAISLVGQTIYEKLIRGYTEKQWGRPCDELPASIIKRIPVRFTFDNDYFNDAYQGIPKDGYTNMIDRMLGGTEVILGTSYSKFVSDYPDIADRTIYCGPIDEFYQYRYGHLDYRSLRFETEEIPSKNVQGVAVTNYTDRDIPYTRTIEHKHFNGAAANEPFSFVTKEYPLKWEHGAEPYYPINDERNMTLYERYSELAKQEDKIVFAGRLGRYRYYDMDDAIKAAFELVDSEMSRDI